MAQTSFTTKSLSLPFIGFLVMIVLIPIEELIVLPSGQTYIRLLGIFTFGIWVASILCTRGKIRFAFMPTILVIFWCLWGITSFFWAKDQSVVTTRITTMVQLLAFFILFQNLVKTDKRLKIILFAYFCSAVVLSLIGVGIEFVAIEPLFTPGRLSLSKIQNPNHLSITLGGGLLLIPYIFNQLKKFFWKVMTILGVGALVPAILFAGSRGTWISLIAAVSFSWIVTKGKVIKLRNLIIISIALLSSVLILSYYGVISNYTMERLATIPTVAMQSSSGISRQNILYVGLEMVKDNPIIGVGLNNFPVRFWEYAERAGLRMAYGISRGTGPHNTFLSVQSELGIVGIVIFISFFGVIFKALLSHRSDPRSMVGILLLSFMIFRGITGTLQYTKFFWLTISLAALIPIVIKGDLK